MNEHIFEHLNKDSFNQLFYIFNSANSYEKEDCTQDALLSAWERRADIEPETINNYVKKSATTNYIKNVKKKKILNDLMYMVKGLLPTESPPAELSLELQEFHKKAQQVISLLSPIRQKTLKYHLMNYSIQDISKLTHSKYNTVVTRLHYIRLKLKNELSEYCDLIKTI